MTKKPFKLSFRTILSVITFFLVAFVVYKNWPDIVNAANHLGDTNIFVLLLLIPEQLFMYYACGQIFFSYLKNRHDVVKTTWKERLKISTELNFINHAVPAGGIGGLTYLTFRLRPFGVSAGQSSFLYIFRYAITTVINYAQAFIAVVVLLLIDKIPGEAMWVIPVSLIMNIGVFLGLALIVFIASGEKRIERFSKMITKIGNTTIEIITFGYKKRAIDGKKIRKYFFDIYESVSIAKKDKGGLKGPIKWGIIYSLCEIGTYYIVALSLGRPELLPYIMIGEAIGSVFDGIVPYGLYELGMAGVMIALGVDFSTSTIVVVMTRVVTLIFTIITGIIPYRNAIMTMNKHE